MTPLLKEMDLLSQMPERHGQVIQKIYHSLTSAGFECFLVGGTVRDLTYGKRIHDLDVTTNARPEDIKKLFPRHVPLGEKFGTILTMHNGINVEITTYRSESAYSDGRHPDSVIWGKSAREDVQRRDFTINGLLYDPGKKTIIDYIGGLGDLDNRILRTIGDARERFREDGLRPIRGCRFAASLGLRMDSGITPAVNRNLEVIAKVAPERVGDEIQKAMNATHFGNFLECMRQTGILRIFFPELERIYASWPVFLEDIRIIPGKRLVYFYSLLYYHEYAAYLIPYPEIKKYLARHKTSAFVSKTVELILRYPPDKKWMDYISDNPPEKLSMDTDMVLLLKKNMYLMESKEGRIYVRFWLRYYPSVFPLDLPEDKRGIALKIFFKMVLQKYKVIKQKNEPYLMKHLALDGNDLRMQGWEGKEIGMILQNALDFVMNHPEKNDTEFLLQYARNNFQAKKSR